MLTTFPGALATTVATDRTQWDEVGDRIGHSCTIGTPSWTFVDMVNRSYGLSSTKAENRKRYCATVISNESPANLAAWNEDCNVKLLVFDLSGAFGHYADITAITPDPADPIPCYPNPAGRPRANSRRRP